MSWWDVLEAGAETTFNITEAVAEDFGHTVPGLGEYLSFQQAQYHAGSAIYDAGTGDRDGAINHGVQAAYGYATAIPGISEGAGLVDLALGIPTTVGRAAVETTGGDGDYVPGGVGDALGQAAVGLTRGVFGEDDSNWIAEGDTPTGTRRNEINAGLTGSFGAPGFLLGDNVADMLAEDPDGPTSGVGGDAGLVGDMAQHNVESIIDTAEDGLDWASGRNEEPMARIPGSPSPTPADGPIMSPPPTDAELETMLAPSAPAGPNMSPPPTDAELAGMLAPPPSPSGAGPNMSPAPTDEELAEVLGTNP